MCNLLKLIVFSVIFTLTRGSDSRSSSTFSDPLPRLNISVRVHDTGVGIIAFGDSLTAGAVVSKKGRTYSPYAHILENNLANATRVLPIGFCGHTSRSLVESASKSTREDAAHWMLGSGDDTLPGIDVALKRYSPQLVIILVGTNDVLKPTKMKHLEPRRILEDIITLHSKAHERGIKTIAAGIPEVSL